MGPASVTETTWEGASENSSDAYFRLSGLPSVQVVKEGAKAPSGLGVSKVHLISAALCFVLGKPPVLALSLSGL